MAAAAHESGPKMKILASILCLLLIPVTAVASGPDAAGELSENTVIRLSEPVSRTVETPLSHNSNPYPTCH